MYTQRVFQDDTPLWGGFKMYKIFRNSTKNLPLAAFLHTKASRNLKGVRQYYMISYYNEKTDSVDVVLSSHTTLRLCCQTIFPTVTTTPQTYELMVKLSRENPLLFAEMTLDQRLESYLESLL